MHINVWFGLLSQISEICSEIFHVILRCSYSICWYYASNFQGPNISSYYESRQAHSIERKVIRCQLITKIGIIYFIQLQLQYVNFVHRPNPCTVCLSKRDEKSCFTEKLCCQLGIQQIALAKASKMNCSTPSGKTRNL